MTELVFLLAYTLIGCLIAAVLIGNPETLGDWLAGLWTVWAWPLMLGIMLSGWVWDQADKLLSRVGR